MSACEKCWNDAYTRSQMFGGGQAERYRELLEERKDNPCSETEQRDGFTRSPEPDYRYHGRCTVAPCEKHRGLPNRENEREQS